MDMRHELAVEQRGDFQQDMRLGVSVRQIVAASMLQLSSVELHDTITQELSDNPALEVDEVQVCDGCGTPLLGSICPTCLRLQKSDLSLSGDDADEADWAPGAVNGLDDGLDRDALYPDRATLADRLIAELGTVLAAEDAPIAEQLVGNLDERGYLTGSLEDVAEILGVELGRVELVLAALQSLEPAGVGARDVRECLLIQLDQLALQGVECTVARRLVADHLEELARRCFERLRRLLDVPIGTVLAAADLVRLRLNPRPIDGHAALDAVTAGRSTYVIPDVVIVMQDDGFLVEVVESGRLNLRLSAAYGQLSRQSAGLSEQEREHVRQYTARARLFVSNIEQRRATMKRVTEAIVRAQPEFLRRGIRHLVPLTRMEIANEVGLDESTISRATLGKHVLLPDGSVVPFATFFRPRLVIHDVMREILADETRPLTDADIRQELADRGIRIARRTVAKYRGQLRVLPATFRNARSA
jgi:RNA polymerase sigma-54 factor